MGIFKDNKSPYYQFSFTFKGCRYRGSTGFEKKSDAQAYYDNERRKIRLGETNEDTVITLVEAFDKYEENHAMFLSSYASIQSHVNHLLEYFGNNKYLHEIGEAEFQEYITHCRNEKYQKVIYSPTRKKMIPVGAFKKTSNATINRRISAFSGMHKMAKKKLKVKVQHIDFEDYKQKERKLTDNTLANFEVAEKLWDVAPMHVRNFIVITLYLGWRKSNVLSLNGKKQIILNADQPYMKTIGKGNKEIIDPIPDGLLEYITANGLHEMDYPCAYKGKPIKDIKTSWKTMFKKAGIKYIRPHDMRHTFGTWLYKQSGDQRLVQDSLHHSDIRTSIGYTHTDMEDRRDKMNDALTYRFKQVKAIK